MKVKTCDITILKKMVKKNLFIFVSGGGCKGLKYNFMEKNKGLTLLNKNNLKIKTDIFSYFYLKESELYINVVNLCNKIVIKNSTIRDKCLCGMSFKL
ncbi:hypothetical protein [Candidatus Vidania fulgoroideorum]